MHSLGVLRPSAEAFRRAGWTAANRQVLHKYIDSLITASRKHRNSGKRLLPEVQEFLDFIEKDPVVFTDFIRMFEGATEHPKNHTELVGMLNQIFSQAPAFGDLGPPVYMIMAQNMNTQGGFSAYTKESLNYHFKKMFTTWVQFLNSKDSRYVLNNKEDGWFGPTAVGKLVEEYPGRTFEEVFICDPRKQYYGYVSFEDFFNRRFRSPQWDRPTESPGNVDLISAACESVVYAFQTDVKRVDELFIKDEAYSLEHLLAGHHVDEFVGGSVLQGFLNTTGYHRWHTPVDGYIKEIIDIPGTYFAQSPNTIGDSIPSAESNEPPPFLKSLRFFSNTAARQLIFIEAGNMKLGLVCFIAIGMTEISSCEATVSVGQYVARGDELGMFHFGGSSSAVVFRKDANVTFYPEFTAVGAHLPINQTIAKCRSW